MEENGLGDAAELPADEADIEQTWAGVFVIVAIRPTDEARMAAVGAVMAEPRADFVKNLGWETEQRRRCPHLTVLLVHDDGIATRMSLMKVITY